MVTRVGSAGLALALAVLAGSGCARRTPEEQAAVRAQDACIAALEPASKNQQPSTDALGVAARDAEAAAKVDDRWSALRSRVVEFRSRAGDQASLHALVQECDRVNKIVKERRSSPGSLG